MTALEIQQLNDCSTLESDLKFVGITAVEDLLQDQVANCIRDFKEADIRVWMLTGDKGETAQQIGYLCGLFGHDFQLYKIDETEKDVDVKEKLMLVAGLKENDYGFLIAGNKMP